MPVTERVPFARSVLGAEDSNASRADGGSEMHRAAIMPDKHAGSPHRRGTDARRRETAKIGDRTGPEPPQAIRTLALPRRANKHQAQMRSPDRLQNLLPVLVTPIFDRLLGPNTGGDNREVRGCTERRAQQRIR